MAFHPEPHNSTSDQQLRIDESGSYLQNLKDRGLFALYFVLDQPRKVPPFGFSTSQVYFIDANPEVGTIACSSFTGLSASSLRHELGRPMEPGVKTRLVVLAYCHPLGIEQGSVEGIETHYGIDAGFFDRNLGYGFGSFLKKYSGGNQGLASVHPMPLPSEKESFELRWQRDRFGNALSAMLLSPENSSYSGDCPTLLVCIRDEEVLWPDERSAIRRHLFSESYGRLWFQTLSNFDKEAIANGVMAPFEFLLPYCASLAKETAHYLKSLSTAYERARDNIPNLRGTREEGDYPDMMRLTQRLSRDIRSTLRSLSKVQNCPSKRSLILDFEHLSEDTLELHDMIKDTLQRR